MIFINPQDVIIPETRFRREFSERKLLELRESILRIGLIQLPTVEKQGDKYTLRSGERRLRVLSGLAREGIEFHACGTPIPRDMVPAAEWNELNDLQRLEIEVEENVVRVDFTWQERDKAIVALHELRKRQNPGQTVSATASEIVGKPAAGDQISEVSNALIVAKHLENPEVAKAKSQKDALKVIRRIADAKHREKIAANYNVSATPHRLIKGEARDILSSIPDGSFDVIITDPPYGVGADNFGSMAATGHDYEDSYRYWKELVSWLPDETARVAKERAHAYIFCDPRRFDELCALMVLANWTVFPTPLIWDKGNGMLPFPDHGPRRTYESILYAWRGDRKVLLQGKADVIPVTAVRFLLHGAQKPVALYQDLLSRSARPGDTVLDCFGGTGPVLVAGNRLHLACTYIERDDAAYNIALTRIHTVEIDDGGVEQDGLQDIAV